MLADDRFSRALLRDSILSNRLDWAAFQGVEIQKNAVIRPIDNGIGIIIPASAFSSDAERYDFAAVVSKHLEPQ
jgi:hypothetical protein